MGTWYDEVNGRGPSQADQGLSDIQGGFDRVYQHIAPIQRRNEDRAYAEKLAGEDRARKETELNRPVAQPVQDLLNQLSGKLKSGAMTGAYAAKLWKLVQSGKLTQDQAQLMLQDDGAQTPPAAQPAAQPPMEASPAPAPTQAPPLTGPEVQEPVLTASAFTPMKSPPRDYTVPAPIHDRYGPNDTVSRSVEAPPVAPPQAPPAQAVAAPMLPPQAPAVPPLTAQQMPAEPPAPTHKWTVRDTNDLNAAGGYPRPKEKSETEMMLELIKEKGRTDRNLDNNTTKTNIAGDKIAADEQKLKAHVTRWNADRQNLWAIAMAKLEAMQTHRTGQADAKRDVEVMKAAEKALNELRKNDTKLRTSINSLAKDPSTLQEIYDNEDRIREYEKAYLEAKAAVDARAQGSKSTSATSSVTTTTPQTKPAPSVDEFLNNLRGN